MPMKRRIPNGNAAFSFSARFGGGRRAITGKKHAAGFLSWYNSFNTFFSAFFIKGNFN